MTLLYAEVPQTLEEQVQESGYVDITRSAFKRSKGYIITGMPSKRDCLQVAAVHGLHDLDIHASLRYLHEHTLPKHSDTDIHFFLRFIEQKYTVRVILYPKIHSSKGGPYVNVLNKVGVFIIMIVVRYNHHKKGLITESHALQYTRFEKNKGKFIGRIRDSGRHTFVTMIEPSDVSKKQAYKLFHSFFTSSVIQNISVKIRSLHQIIKCKI